MNTIIIANIFGVVSALLLTYMGKVKEKNKVLKLQMVQTFFGGLCDYLLGAYPSVFTNVINIVRNFLVTRGKFNKLYMFVLIVITSILVLTFNNKGYLGLIPLGNFIFYTIFVNTKDNIVFKYIFIVSMITWVIYDFIIKAYTSSAFDLIVVIVAVITLIKMIKEKNKKKNKRRTK